MPEWKIYISIFEDIALATSVVASGIIFYDVGTRKFKGGSLGKGTIEKWLNKKGITPETLLLASFVATLVSPPDLHEWILLVVDFFAYFVYKLKFTETNIYNLFSLILLILGLSMVLYKLASGKIEEVWKESVLGQFFEYLKKFLGF